MNRRNRWTVLGVLATTAAACALAACGSDDSDGGDDETATFISDADAICTEAAVDAREDALADDVLPADEADVAEIYETDALPRIEDTQAQLEALEPPSELSAGYEEFLSLRQERIDLTREAIEAFQGDDLDEFNSINGEINSLIEEIEGAGAEVGFGACGAVMSDESVAEVEARETEVAEASDPSVACEGFFLPQIVQAFYPEEEDPVAACLEDPNSAKSVDVEVTGVEGIDDVVAYATVKFVDEKDPGPFLDTLYFVDGEWKLYSVGPAE